MSNRQTVAAPSLPRTSPALVLFRTGRHHYALPVDRIVQLTLMVTVTSIPELRDVVDGVINVHGQAVPVVDLGRHLGQTSITRQLDTPLLLLQTCGQTAALLVDEIVDIIVCPPDRFVATADLLPAGLAAAPVLSGIVLAPGSMTLLIDPDHLFSPEQAAVLARAVEWLHTRQRDQAPAADQTRPAGELSPS